MAIRKKDVHFEYGTTVKRDDMEPNTIYLDGVVRGPVVDTTRRSYSFDHHGDVVRLATRSTCAQVLTALELGLDPHGFKVVLNDLDADASLALWLLRNPMWARDSRVQEAVRAIGFVDCHGPVREPITLHRALDHGPDEQQTLETLWEDQETINAWYRGVWEYGGGEKPDPVPAVGLLPDGNLLLWDASHIADTGFPEQTRWNHGVAGFSHIYEQGAVVGLIMPEAADGTIGYTVAKRSDFVNYDISAFLTNLDAQEPGWGGGSTIGGAPRNEGGLRSRLDPLVVVSELLKLIPSRS